MAYKISSVSVPAAALQAAGIGGRGEIATRYSSVFVNVLGPNASNMPPN